MLPPIEPSSNLRQGAIAIRSLYLALVEFGFTDEQAFELTKLLATPKPTTSE